MRQSTLILLLCLFTSANALTPWQSNAIAEAVRKGSWETSETLFRELKTSDLPPSQARSVDYNLGVSLLNQDKFEDSLPFFEAASKEEKDRFLKAKALYNQGNAYFKLEKLEEAKKAYQQALLVDPDDDDARYNIEVILNQQKEEQEQKDKQDPQDSSSPEEQKPKQEGDSEQKDQSEGEQKKEQGDEQEQNSEEKHNGEQVEQQQEPEGSAESQMTEAEKKAAQEDQERARLLDYFSQQEKAGRPAVRMQPQAPPMRGKTW